MAPGFLDPLSIRRPTLPMLPRPSTFSSTSSIQLPCYSFANRVRRSTRMSPVQGSALLVATVAVALWTDIAADMGTIAEMLTLISLTVCFLRPVPRVTLMLAPGAGILLAFAALFKLDLRGVACG